MTTTSLQLEYRDLLRATGFRLGKGRDDAAWTAPVLALVDEMVQHGYRQFLNPPPIDGRTHRWSFMEPTITLTTVSGTGDYLLPQSFGGTRGPFTFASGLGWPPIRFVDEARIRSMRTGTTGSGRPCEAAIRPKAFDPQVGQRHEVLFAPVPDGAYVLSYAARMVASKLSDSAPIPLGGAEFGEALLASCLASAEHYVNQEKGEAYQDFLEKVSAAISTDREAHTPDNLGYMGVVDAWGDGRPLRHQGSYTVTVNGATV